MAYTTIDNPELYFQNKLYTGTGSTLSVTLDGDTDMQPDLIWIEVRNQSSSAMIQDAVRGTDGTSYRASKPSANSAESTNSGFLTTIGSDGFTVGTNGKFNASSDTYVASCWKAGGGAGSSNEAGSINTTSTSVNTTSKFSISTYTGNDTAGATIGHGIGSAPHFVMVKCRSHAQHWAVYHHKNTSAPETDFLMLSSDAATADSVNRWNDTAPSSTLITFGQENQINGPSYTYVAYAWSEVQGYSKFGTYKGNGNADGTFVYTGFRPAWIMSKISSDADDWILTNSKISPFNPVEKYNEANQTASELTSIEVDFLSNGFKWRHTDNQFNAAETYIYAAFAEAPFVNSKGVPCNAR